MADFIPSFKPGDVVQLKSGGSLLTVWEETKDGVYVYYADATGMPQIRNQALPAILLKKEKPRKPSGGGTII